MQKIGLYGGTFDPIHIGHLLLAEWAQQDLGLDRVYFIPASIHAFKRNGELSDSKLRFRLVQTAIRDFPGFSVSRIELDRDGISYAVDTVTDFRRYEQVEGADLYYLMGMDNLKDFHRWKQPDEIMKQAQITVFARPGYEQQEIHERYKDSVLFLNSPVLDLSASGIRSRIAAGKSVRGMVTPAVYEIINAMNLYR